MGEERIAKVLARRGVCSRREAERLIAAGHVLVNGVPVREQGTKVAADSAITITDEGRALLAQQVTVALHKPAGVVSTQPHSGQTPAWKLLSRNRLQGPAAPELVERVVKNPASLSVAGRLDRTSRGLLILTQDGAVARRIIGGHGIEKVYVVRTAERITDEHLRKLRGALFLDGKPLLPMKIERLADRSARFVLVEGRKHQIRRICRHVGVHVVDLFRESIGPLRIGNLEEGCWRLVYPAELELLLAGTSQRIVR